VHLLDKIREQNIKEQCMLEIYNYNSGKGDCLRIRFTGTSEKIHNIIVDSGVIRFGASFKSICEGIHNAGETIDYLFITHEDEDHLGGLLWNLRNRNTLRISEVKMNGSAFYSSYLSTQQNNEVYKILNELAVSVTPAVSEDVIEIDGAFINVLWPNKEQAADHFHPNTSLSYQSDYEYTFEELADKVITMKDASQSNKSSIVFEFLYEGKKMLFTGDAWAEDIVAVSADKYDVIKLPHHGSIRNISEQWKNIKCNQFIICTDGVMHPDKQTLAKLQKWNGEITVHGSKPWWKKMILSKEKCSITFIEGECLTC
jgi:beta-lactamase superfamily II metal-dependent hydrolase